MAIFVVQPNSPYLNKYREKTHKNGGAEKYLEAIKKYPLYENLAVELVPAAVKSTHEDIRVLGITEVKEGKLEDALKRTVNMMVMFQSIPGYRYPTELYYKVEEALALIGMSFPEQIRSCPSINGYFVRYLRYAQIFARE